MPPLKGSPEHEAWRLKIQATMKRRLADPEIRVRHVERMNAAVRSGDGCRRRVEGVRRVAQDPEFQRRRLAAMRTPEARAKAAESQARRWADQNVKAKHRAATARAMARPEAQERLHRGVERWRAVPGNVERLQTAAHSPYALKKLRASLRRAWADPVRRAPRIDLLRANLPRMRAQLSRPEVEQRRLEGLAAAFRRDPSSIEVTVHSLLEAFDIEFEAQRVIGRYIVDIFVPDRNLIIECDGQHWHANSKPDRLRDAWLTAQGFRVVRLSEMEIRRDATGLLASALEDAGG